MTSLRGNHNPCNRWASLLRGEAQRGVQLGYLDTALADDLADLTHQCERQRLTCDQMREALEQSGVGSRLLAAAQEADYHNRSAVRRDGRWVRPAASRAVEVQR